MPTKPTLMIRLTSDYTLEKALIIVQDYHRNINKALQKKEIKTADEIYTCIDVRLALSDIEDQLKEINRKLNKF